MAIIRWLHLTDLHEGMGEQKRLWPTVEGEFFDDFEAAEELKEFYDPEAVRNALEIYVK